MVTGGKYSVRNKMFRVTGEVDVKGPKNKTYHIHELELMTAGAWAAPDDTSAGSARMPPPIRAPST